MRRAICPLLGNGFELLRSSSGFVRRIREHEVFHLPVRAYQKLAQFSSEFDAIQFLELLDLGVEMHRGVGLDFDG